MAKGKTMAAFGAELRKVETPPVSELAEPGRPGRKPAVGRAPRTYMLAGQFSEEWRSAVKQLMAQPRFIRMEIRDMLALAVGAVMQENGIAPPPT